MEGYIGEIRMFAGNYAPEGWHLCDGTELSTSGNEALYSIIQNTYGGTAPNTFRLPDLRGRLPVGQGQGPQRSARTMGESFGVETVTLTDAQMFLHTHALFGSTTAAASTTPALNLLATTTAEAPLYSADDPVNLPQPFSPAAVSTVGGSGPHSNMMPSLCINFIIALTGVFPSRA